MKQIPAVLLVALAGCPSSGGSKGKDPDGPKPPTSPATGMLLYQDDDALHWFDLDTKDGGEVAPPVGYPDWSRATSGFGAAWVHGYDADENPLVAVIHRGDGAIDAQDVGQDVLDVSPDGTKAILPCPDEFQWCVAPIDGNQLGEGEKLDTGGDYPELVGWLDDGRVVVLDISSDVAIQVIDPETKEMTPAGEVDATETPFVSQDGKTLAWLYSDDDDFATAVTKLSWRPLFDEDAAPTELDLGAGYTGECTFAEGGATIVCMLLLYEEDVSRVLAIHLATKTVHTISEHAISVWPAVSPDGSYLSYAEDREGTPRLCIAGISGGEPKLVFGDGPERQFAVSWLR